MNNYKIADLNINIKVEGKILEKQIHKYKTKECRMHNMSIKLDEGFLDQKLKENSNLTTDECEYIFTGSEFYSKLLEFKGFMLHSSAIAMNNKAYLFSADSGIGKSTHAKLWQTYFGEDKALIVNDDKPAIRLIDNRFYVYGTPWSGKTDKNLNLKVPLHSITFIERSEDNWINKIDSKEAIKLIMNQTLRPRQLEKIDKLLTILDELLKIVPIYKMGCNISEVSVKLAYDYLNEVK